MGRIGHMRRIGHTKRALTLGAVLALALCACIMPSVAFGLTIEIPVAIDEGGVAVIVPDDGSPAPRNLEIAVEDQEEVPFSIDIYSPGTYNYTIHVKDEGEEGVQYDKTVYVAAVSVFAGEEDTMYGVVTISKEDEPDKPETIHFTSNVRSAHRDPNGDDPSGSGSPVPGGSQDGSAGSGGSGAAGQPKTGDSSNLELYLLVSTFASAGLFALSVVYAVSTRKQIRQRQACRCR